ncbi:hypothetical protein DDZ18_09170 [Marinicauda salina]|uniref:Uncharacterized protein n=1 Tax=Marinicauda salina TaxID=2135793 RepID=A0A2U2BUZ9_9PROT|nr:hypothetical protein [Marinicauda salina]PWE17809.1 hypothetical protein DDZ18_09170 [Marinicauda salina]
MSAREEEVWGKAEPLATAWREFADYGLEGFDRRGSLRLYERPKAKETIDDIVRREQMLASLEANLKKEFLTRIEGGEFDAYGRDISQAISSPIVKIPNSFFNQDAAGFEVDFDASRLNLLGKTIIDIRVIPADTSKEALAASNGDAAEVSPSDASEMDEQRRPAHRPNTQDAFKAKVREAVRDDPEFLLRGNRTDQAREIKARLYGEGARNLDDMAGCNIDSARRWVGEVANEIIRDA